MIPNIPSHIDRGQNRYAKAADKLVAISKDVYLNGCNSNYKHQICDK